MVTLDERIPGFVQLDAITSYCRPRNTTSSNGTINGSHSQHDEDPDLLVFCSWMSAAPKHIVKYTASYQKLFPNTAILLVEARLGDMFTTNPHTAARKLITSHIEAKDPQRLPHGPSILLHASSNGGGNSAATLATLLKRQGYAAPFDAITLDCSPGKAAIQSTARAIQLSLPDILLLRTLTLLLVYAFLFAYMLYIETLRKENKVSWIRRVLNDRSMLGVNVPRLYLYSKGDVLVEAGHVREHAEEARRKGCGDVVVEEVFERAPHCALLNEDAARYWAAVERHVRKRRRRFEEGRWVTAGSVA